MVQFATSVLDPQRDDDNSECTLCSNNYTDHHRDLPHSVGCMAGGWLEDQQITRIRTFPQRTLPFNYLTVLCVWPLRCTMLQYTRCMWVHPRGTWSNSLTMQRPSGLIIILIIILLYLFLNLLGKWGTGNHYLSTDWTLTGAGVVCYHIIPQFSCIQAICSNCAYKVGQGLINNTTRVLIFSPTPLPPLVHIPSMPMWTLVWILGDW